MGALTLIRHNAHRVDVDGHAMLMHVPTTSLFELDGVARDVYDLFRSAPAVDPDLMRARRCLLYTSPSPRDQRGSRMPSSA